MDWTVSEGKTLKEAINNLLTALGADRSEVEIEELGEKKKMFGLGKKVIRVRGKLKDDAFDHDVKDVSMADLSREIAKIGGADLSEIATATVKYLNDVLKKMGIDDAQVKAKEHGETLNLEVSSKAGGLVIGRKGETLEALQVIAEIFATRRKGGRMRVTVDTEDYRTRQKGKLEDVARKAAKDAVSRGRKVLLKPMGNAERKVIHALLQDHPEVETKSEGKGDGRRVAVIPKNPKPAGERTEGEREGKSRPPRKRSRGRGRGGKPANKSAGGESSATSEPPSDS